MEKEKAMWIRDKANPLILKRRFGVPVLCESSLFVCYLVDEPFLINKRTVSNKQCPGN